MPQPPRRFADYTPRDPGPTAPVLDVPRHRWPAAWDALTTARIPFASLPDPHGRRLIRTTHAAALMLRRDFAAAPLAPTDVPPEPPELRPLERGALARLPDTPRDPALAHDPDPPPPRRPARRTKPPAAPRRRRERP